MSEEICNKHGIQKREIDCFTCHGDGEVEWDDDFGDGTEMITCWKCNGKGIAPWLICEHCEDEESAPSGEGDEG